MIRLFQFLLCGHFHKWHIVDRISIWSDWGDGHKSDMPIARKILLQCEYCGEMKEKTISSQS